jgi:hypothetical protein
MFIRMLAQLTIYSRPADYQPGVEVFQQGVAYQFAK